MEVKQRNTVSRVTGLLAETDERMSKKTNVVRFLFIVTNFKYIPYILLLFLLYKNDILQGLPHSYAHRYTDDRSIFYQRRDIMKIENALNKKFVNVLLNVL